MMCGQPLSLTGEVSYRSTPLRQRHVNHPLYAVMYVGPVRKVRGDKRWEANCSPKVGTHQLYPQTQ